MRGPADSWKIAHGRVSNILRLKAFPGNFPVAMRSLSNNETFKFYGETIGPEFDLSAHTDLAALRDEWDLTQLSSVETVRSLEADAERIQKRSSSRWRYVLFGALAGGFLDSLDGDDGVADGAILGGLVGLLLSPRIGEPSAIVKLHFRDGRMLTLEVSRAEFAALEEAASKAGLHRHRQDGTSFARRPLDDAEITRILRMRRSGSALSMFVMAGLFLIVPLWFGLLLTNAAGAASTDLGHLLAGAPFRYALMLVGPAIGLGFLLAGLRTRNKMALDRYRLPSEPGAVAR